MAGTKPSESDERVWRVEVAVPVPLPQTYSYLAEPDGDDVDRPPREGDLVGVPFGRRRELIGLVTAVTRADGSQRAVEGRPLRKVRRLLPEAYRLERDRLDLARWLAGYYGLPLGEVVPLFHPPSPGTRARTGRTEPVAYPLQDSHNVTLNRDQRRAVDAATAHLASGSFGVILVHGVTGSGKTEVYLRTIADALERGRGAIYLLPEIALTPQTLARITERFGDEAAAIHSSLSAGERCRVHEAAASGRVRGPWTGPRARWWPPATRA